MKRLVLFATLILVVLNARAYDFSAVAPSGQTLYYNIVDGGVEVTCPGSANASGWNGHSKPTGALVLPATVTNSGVTYSLAGVGRYAFFQCSGLTSVVVPEGVINIGQAAFSGCSNIDTLSLPSTLVSLGLTALYNCSSLEAISCAAMQPPTVAGSSLTGIVASTCALWVPCAAMGTYAAATGWSDFDIRCHGPLSVTLTAVANNGDRGTVSGSGIYEVGTVVTVTATAAEGYFFAFWHDGDTLNPRLVNLVSDTVLTAMFYPAPRDTVVDTVLLHDTVVVHDTLFYPVLTTDTVVVYDTTVLYDTIYSTDTVRPTYYRLQVTGNEGGVGIGSAVVPAGTVLQIGALPMEGYRFSQWDDGSTDNPRQVTMTGDATLNALFVPLTGIAVTTTDGWTASVEGHCIVIGGAEGRQVTLYDIQGRRCFTGRATAERMVLQVSAAGIYLVSVDDGPARKVIMK